MWDSNDFQEPESKKGIQSEASEINFNRSRDANSAPRRLEGVLMLRETHVHVTRPPAYTFLGVTMAVHLPGLQTGGRFSMIEATMPPGGDGGLHMHTREDESIYLLDGSLDVTIGDDAFTLKAGESYFAPRNVPHRLRNNGETPARALLVNSPGTFDEFVRRAGIPVGTNAVSQGEPDAAQILNLVELAGEFGIKILAPPELARRI
jgi:mannose-6-phosphate isomerase-like protein (cupin superfamily)